MRSLCFACESQLSCRREILCEANVSRPLQLPTSTLNKKHAGVRNDAQLAASSSTWCLKPEDSFFVVDSHEPLYSFDALKSSHPEKELTVVSVPHLNQEQEVHRGPQIIKHMFTGKAVRLPFVFFVFFVVFTYIINSLQVVYKHWYRLKNELESSIDFLSVSLHCVSLQIAITFLKSGVLASSNLLKHRPEHRQQKECQGVQVGLKQFDIDLFFICFLKVKTDRL